MGAARRRRTALLVLLLVALPLASFAVLYILEAMSQRHCC
jgi:hypothetical protein